MTSTYINKIRFIENNLPPITSGLHQIKLEHHIKANGEGGLIDSVFTDQKNILIKGEKFSLKPQQIYSVFPANNSIGNYTNVFPHVVLNSASLPWQRAASKANNQFHYPWLALLVFYEDEQPELKQLSIEELNKNHKIFYSSSLEDLEQQADQCQVIDLKLDLFNKIAPTKEDLIYLAHVREVSIEKKVIDPQLVLSQESISNKQSFSVVVANRLPPKGGNCYIHLVSLENMGNYLPEYENNKLIHSAILEQYDSIRLISLKNWQFIVSKNNQEAKGNFLSQAIAKLNQSDLAKSPNNNPNYQQDIPITLKLPIKEEATNDLKVALDMGYVPMNHQMRDGSTTISWYRGPLIPYKTKIRMINKDSSNINDKKPISLYNTDADQLLLYDPDWQMFDTSYAAAWQLGRLLAVQNKKFAQDLYNYKQQQLHKLINNHLEIHYQQTLVALNLATPMLTNDSQDIKRYSMKIEQILTQILTKILIKE